MAETEAVASSTITVQRGDWAYLPEELAVMVAPPVVVSSAPVAIQPPGPAPLNASSTSL